MAKFVCTVCGYVYEGEAAPAECPICHAPALIMKAGSMTGEFTGEDLTDDNLYKSTI